MSGSPHWTRLELLRRKSPYARTVAIHFVHKIRRKTTGASQAGRPAWTYLELLAPLVGQRLRRNTRQLPAGLYSPASSHQPPGGSIGAIIGSRIEGNRRAWGSLMNSVEDDFE